MDIENYFHGIEFVPVGKQGNFYIMEARINTGDEMIIRVITTKKAKYLGRMKWKKLWGLPTEKAFGRHRLQNFFPNETFSRNKTLSLESTNHKTAVYMSNIHPYLITIANTETDDQYSREDGITLAEAIGMEGFEVKNFS